MPFLYLFLYYFLVQFDQIFDCCADTFAILCAACVLEKLSGYYRLVILRSTY